MKIKMATCARNRPAIAEAMGRLFAERRLAPVLELEDQIRSDPVTLRIDPKDGNVGKMYPGKARKADGDEFLRR